MNTFDTLCIIGGVCALLMVIGAMVLLYKGTITLSEKNAQDALTLEFKKMINITTRYPALGLFIIGWAFLGLVLYLSKTNSEIPIEIRAMLKSDDPASAVVLGSATMLQTIPASDGGIDAFIYPSRVDAIRIEIVTPGYSQGKISKVVVPRNIRGTVINLGELNPGAKITDKPSLNPANIVAAPPNLPSLQESGKF